MLVHVCNMVHMVKTLVLITRGRKCATYCLVSNALKCCCGSGVLGEKTTFFFLTDSANCASWVIGSPSP